MSYRLYETKLANHKLFKDVKDSFSELSNTKIQNLIELKDEVLYIWNPRDSYLFAINVTYLDENGDEAPYQKLHLVAPPSFPVERIMSSECGTRICLWGSQGVTLVELPSRWGRSGLFDTGNQTILCKSMSLDERFFYLQSEILRVHWHPRSLSHVLVLISDNTMRLYNIAVKNTVKLVKVFSVGRKPEGSLGRTVLESLGDTAVDFTPTPDAANLLILTGNGDVYMMPCDLDGKSLSNPSLRGPLAMYPPADDNYGSESCSILALGGADTPTVVVIASASAVLYHCLLLPNASEESGESFALYVVESVELNIVQSPTDPEMNYTYPVHLYQGPRGAYACVHTSGVHAVHLPLLQQLRDYAMALENETEALLSSICMKPSSARYLVCTSGNAVNPPVGLAVTPAPLHNLLILCSSGEILTRTLEPVELEEQLYKELHLRNSSLDQDDINNLLKEKQKLSFTSIMQEVLLREVSQPLLKLDKKEQPEPKECLEVLTEATVKLRGEYIVKQERALDLLARKALALKTLGGQQREWLADLQIEINNVQEAAVELKKKRDLAEKFQEDMKYRCSTVVRALRACSGSSAEERRLLGDLQQYARNVRHLEQALQQLKVTAAQKNDELKKWQDEYKKKETALGRSHSESISSILQQQTSKISSLVEETKLLKDQLGVA